MIFNEEQSLIQQTARQYVAEKITPFAALVPYNAAAEGPFNT